MRPEEASDEGRGHRVSGEGAGWEWGGEILSGQSSRGRRHGGGGCTEPGRMVKVFGGSLPLGVEAGHKCHLAFLTWSNRWYS